MNTISTEKFRPYILKILDNVNTNNHLVSFASEINNFNLMEKFSSTINIYEKTFYWEIPSEQFSFYGLGELITISESGKGRFLNVQKKIKEWQTGFLSNWEEYNLKSVPLFIGGMKFSSEGESELWEHFDDANWFVPKIIFFKNKTKTFLIYNFLVSSDSSAKKIEEDFNRRINYIINQKNSSDYILPQFNCIYGNTPKEKKKWVENVKKALEKIDADEIRKVVLARQVEINFNEEPSVSVFLKQLEINYPDCYSFAFHSGKSIFFGASPEKLCKINEEWLEVDALAGSAPRGKNEKEDKVLEKELQSSKKNLLEHDTVVKHVAGLFEKYSEAMLYDPSPKIKKLKNIQHLWTPIKIKLNSDLKIFNVLEGLHHTPAVCGYPQNEALNIIKKFEDFPRGLYSGIIGWFNYSGEGEFTIALRSALLKGKKLYAFAGGGIVEGSNPSDEYKETELKLKPILSLFNK